MAKFKVNDRVEAVRPDGSRTGWTGTVVRILTSGSSSLVFVQPDDDPDVQPFWWREKELERSDG